MRTIATENPQLLQMIAQFHWQPAKLIHNDRWPTSVPESVRRALHSNNRCEQRLSKFAAEHWGIDLKFRHTFESSAHRIALLLPEQLGTLALLCAATAHAESIVHSIDNASQTAYRQTLGPIGFHFVLKRASFVGRSLPPAWRAKPSSPSAIETSIRESGRKMIAACLDDAPEELQRRCSLAFPQSATSNSDQPDPRDPEGVWPLVKRLLLTEIDPKLKPCFD